MLLLPLLWPPSPFRRHVGQTLSFKRSRTFMAPCSVMTSSSVRSIAVRTSCCCCCDFGTWRSKSDLLTRSNRENSCFLASPRLCLRERHAMNSSLICVCVRLQYLDSVLEGANQRVFEFFTHFAPFNWIFAVSLFRLFMCVCLCVLLKLSSFTVKYTFAVSFQMNRLT